MQKKTVGMVLSVVNLGCLIVFPCFAQQKGMPGLLEALIDGGCYLLACIIFGCPSSFYRTYFKGRYMAYAGIFIVSYILFVLVTRYFLISSIHWN